jgi:hypothetical protein
MRPASYINQYKEHFSKMSRIPSGGIRAKLVAGKSFLPMVRAGSTGANICVDGEDLR